MLDVESVRLLVSLFGFVLACVSSGEGNGRLFQGQENDTNINTGQATVPLGSMSTHTATGDVPDLGVLALGGYTHVRKHILSPWMAAVQLPNVGVFGNYSSFCVTKSREVDLEKKVVVSSPVVKCQSMLSITGTHMLLKRLASDLAVVQTPLKISSIRFLFGEHHMVHF